MFRTTLLVLFAVPVFGSLVTVDNCPLCTVNGDISGFGTDVITVSANLYGNNQNGFGYDPGPGGTASVTGNFIGSTDGPPRPGLIEFLPSSVCGSLTDGPMSASAGYTVGPYSGSAAMTCWLNGGYEVDTFAPFELGVPFDVSLNAVLQIPSGIDGPMVGGGVDVFLQFSLFDILPSDRPGNRSPGESETIFDPPSLDPILVPEPGTIVLAAPILGALALLARRRNRRPL
jgi:hypothetical protein